MKNFRPFWYLAILFTFLLSVPLLEAQDVQPQVKNSETVFQQNDAAERAERRMKVLQKIEQDKIKEALLKQQRNFELPQEQAIDEEPNAETNYEQALEKEQSEELISEENHEEAVNKESSGENSAETQMAYTTMGSDDEIILEPELLIEMFAAGVDPTSLDSETLALYKAWLEEQEPPSEMQSNVYETVATTDPGDELTVNLPGFSAPSWIYSPDSVVLGANLNEDFEGGEIPDNWTVINADGGTHWWEPTTVNPHGGTYAARVHWESTSLDNDDWIITPPLAVFADSVNEISFWLRTYNGTYDDPWEVLVSTTDTNPGSFTVIDSGPGALADYVKKSYSLDSYGDAIVYVAVRYIGSYDWYLYVDDFIGPPVVFPSCPMPDDLTATNLTISSADLGWTPQGTETTWNIVWGDPGFDPETQGTLISGVTSNPYTLTGLNMLTQYEFYVQSDCGGGDISDWSGPLLFQTTSDPISGNYTINSTMPTGGTNFTSFTDFASAANLGGLAGAVTVDVVAGTGPYNEQVTLNELPNSSQTNTLTINGNGETLEFLSTETDNRATFKFDGTDYIIVNNLVVKALGEASGEYGWAVWLTNDADYNTFSNCTFEANTTATSTAFAAFVSSSSATGATTAGLAASNLTVDSCLAMGGYYCMVINGPTSAPFAENNVITNNEIKDFYYYGLYCRGNNNSVLSQNTIHRPDRTTISTAYMLYLNSNQSGNVVTKNRIYEFAGSSSTTSTAYGIYGSTLSADVGAELLIANNSISGYDNMDGTNYGMYFSTSAGVGNLEIYHNSVSVDNVDHPDTDLIRGIYCTGANAKVVLLNNVVSVTSNSTGTKYCLYFGNSTSSITSDHNVLHMGATLGTNNIGYWDGTSFLTFADWQAANNGFFDQNSVNVDPLFISPATGNLTPGNPLMDDIGTDLTAIVPDDINGVLRSTTPDPGAYEFDVSGCIQPGNLMAENIMGTSADLSWTDNNIPAATMWDIELGMAGFTPTGVPTAAGVTNNPYTYSSLTPNTEYEWYVRADCGGGDYSVWVGPHSFTTACASLPAPYIETFQNTTIPNCWTMSGPQDWLFTTTWPDYGADGLQDHTGTGGSFAGVDGSGTASLTGITLLSPIFDLSALTEPQLRFYLFNNNEDNDDYQTLSVDLWNGTAWNNGIFTWGPTDNDTAWVEVELVLTPFNITGDIQIRFVVDKSAGSPYYDDLIIDDVRIEEAPDCPNPVGLGVENVTATSADLLWGSASGLSDVELGLAGFTPTGVPTHTEVVSPLSITGLTPATSYSFYVRDICTVGSYSTWSGPFNFTTECATFIAPFTETFENTTIPNCWVMYGPDDWLFTTTWPDYGADGLEDHTGTGGSFAGVDGSTPANITGITLETPFIDASTLTEPQLRFYLFNNNVNNDDYQTLSVDLWNGTAWNDGIFFWGPTDNDPDWVEVEVVLSPFNITGDIQFRFVVDKSSGNPFYDDLIIDDVRVEEAPDCPKPVGLGVENVTATSADLLWGSASGLSDVELGLGGFTPTGVPTHSEVVSPLTVTNLTPATDYAFYVRDVCGAGMYSNWNGPFNFTTECATYPAPFIETFQNTTIPNCWEMYGPDDWLFTTTWPDYGADGLEDHTGTNGSFAGVDGSTPNNITGITLETPLIDVSSLTNPQLRFYLFNNNVDNTDWQSLSIDLWNGTAWNTGIFFWGPTDNNPDWVEVELVLTPYNITGDIQFKFIVDKSAGSPYYDDLIIDDVHVEEAPACPKPVGLGAENITATSADLIWGSVSGLSDVELGLAGFTPTGVPTHAEVVSPLSITNLTPATSYSFYVRDVCGGGEFSNWAGPYSFSTECATVPAPFFEPFQNPVLPNCWVMSGPQDWLFTTTWPDYGADGLQDHTGTNGSFAGVDGSGTAGITGISLETPFFDVSTLTVPQLRFFLFNNNIDNSDYQTLTVDLWDGAAWNDAIFFWGPTDNNPNWVEVEVVLSPYTITGDIQFRFTVDKSSGSPYYDDIVIDDFHVEEAPACPKPINLGVTNVVATSADLTWTSLSGLSDVEFGLGGFTPTGVPTDPNVTSPYTMTGLTAATTYSFYVRDACGGGEYSNWNGPFTFSTPCEVFDIPFNETFDNSTWPLCWEQTVEGGVTSDRWEVTPTNNAGGLPNEMNATFVNATGISRLILPPLDLAGTVPTLKFTYAYDAYGTAPSLTHKVQTSSDGVTWTDENFSFVSGGTNIPPTEVELNLNNNIGPNTYIAFVMDGNHFQFDDWYIDDVEVFQNLFGTLAGTVTELSTGNPVEGAIINVGPYSGVSASDGTYSFNVLIGTYMAGATATGYNSQSGIEVVIEDGIVTTLDFQMTAPEFAVDLSAVNVVINPDQQTTKTLNISNTGNGPGSWTGGLIEIEDKGTKDLFDLQFEYPTSGSSGETAVASDGDFIYTSTWNSSNFHKYGMDGTYIGSFTVGVAGGVRDLTYDGTYFYGAAASASVFEMDLANGNLVSTFSAPTTVRAIAYDEAQDVFYANNMASDIVKFNKSGTNLGSFPVGPNGTDYYGFAVDNYSPGAPYLWGYSRTGNSMNQLIQIQLPDGTETGVTFDVGSVVNVNDGLAGGLVISKKVVPGLQVLTGIVLGEKVWGLELTEAGPDWLELSPIGGTLAAGENEDITLTFDATDLLAGIYEAELHLNFNPAVGPQMVPITMTVDETTVAPINLAASYDCTDVELTWEMPAGASPDSWNVYRDGTLLDNVTSMTYSDLMLDPDVEYCFEVTALYSGVESVAAGPECITIPMPENIIPTELESIANSPNADNITLNWTAPTGCVTPDGYNVYRDSEMINPEMVTDLNYVDTLMENGTYVYEVTAVYYFGESGYSDTTSQYILIIGISENFQGELMVFPNPASHYVQIQSDVRMEQIILLDNSGREVQSEAPRASKHRLDVSQLEQGIYYLKIETRKGHVIRKITVN